MPKLRIKEYAGKHIESEPLLKGAVKKVIDPDLKEKYIMYNKHNKYFSEQRRSELKEERESKELLRKVENLRKKKNEKQYHSFVNH